MAAPFMDEFEGGSNKQTTTNVLFYTYKVPKDNVLIRPMPVKVKDLVKVWTDVLCTEQFQCAQKNCRLVREDNDNDYDDYDANNESD